MALYIMVLMGGTPIGAPILGWLGEVMGPRWTLIGGGAVTVIGVMTSVVVMQIHLQRRAREHGERRLGPRRDLQHRASHPFLEPRPGVSPRRNAPTSREREPQAFG